MTLSNEDHAPFTPSWKVEKDVEEEEDDFFKEYNIEKKNPSLDEFDDDDDDDKEWEMGDPVHDESTTLGRFRNKWGAFFNSNPVQWCNITLIMTNAIMLGVLTFFFENPDVTNAIEKVDRFMIIAFFTENGSQLFYLGKLYFENGWLVFDGIIIILSAAFTGSSISVLRMFRFSRVFLLMSKFEDTKILVAAIRLTVPRLYTIGAVMLLFFYIYMTLFTNLYHDLYIGDGSGRPDRPAPDSPFIYDYFGRMDRSFLSLFQLMTMTSWSALVRQVVDARPWSTVGMYIWMILTGILFMNLVVAIVCGSLLEMTKMSEAIEAAKEARRIRRCAETKKLDKEAVHDTRLIFAFEREIARNNIQIQKAILALSSHPELPSRLTCDHDRKLHKMSEAFSL